MLNQPKIASDLMKNDIIKAGRESGLSWTRFNCFGDEGYVSFRYVHGVNATLSL